MWLWLQRFVPALGPLHEEARQVLRLLRYLTATVIALLIIAVCFMLIRDIKVLFSNGNPTNRSSDVLSSDVLIKTLILGIIGFFVPRMIWMYLIYGDPLIVFRRGRTTAPTASLDPDKPLLEVASFLESSTNNVLDLGGYKKIAESYEKWILDNQVASFRVVSSRFQMLSRELDRMMLFWDGRLHKKNKQVFIWGRDHVGKTSIIASMYDQEQMDSKVNFMFSGYPVRRYDVEDLTFYEFPSLNLSVDASTNGFKNNKLTFLDMFLEFLKVIPDVIIYAVSSKELHNVIKDDIGVIQKCIFHMQLWAIQTVTPPLTCVITHADTVYPADLTHPNDYDDEKHYNFQQLEELVTKTIETENEVVRKCDRDTLQYAQIRFHNVTMTSSRVFWIEKDGIRVPHPSRDYRYQLKKVKSLLQNCSRLSAPLPSDDFFSHRPFALKLSQVYAFIRSSSLQISLVTQYQFEAYTLLLVSTDLSIPLLATPSMLAEKALPSRLNAFFSTLELSTVTYHSMLSLFSKTIRTHLPMLQLTGLFENKDRLVLAAIAFFVDGKEATCVKAVFTGTQIYL